MIDRCRTPPTHHSKPTGTAVPTGPVPLVIVVALVLTILAFKVPKGVVKIICIVLLIAGIVAAILWLTGTRALGI